MARVKEEPRSRLAALQDLLSGSGQALMDQAQTLQRVVVDVGRGVEGQVSSLLTSVEGGLAAQLDTLLTGFATSIRQELDRVRDRLRVVETRVGDVPKDGIREAIAPLTALASTTAERTRALEARIEETLARLQAGERRVAELGRDASHDTTDVDEARQRLVRLDQRVTDVGRDLATKLGDVTALRDRLGRIESRVLDASKDQIARAGEVVGMRDRLARLESRLSDLSREQVARAVESAGLRERVFRLEQRATTPSPPMTSERPATTTLD